MPGRHRGERRRRILAAAAVVLVAAACSSGSEASSQTAPTFAPITFAAGSTTAPSIVAATTVATTTIPPTISTTPVTGPTGVIADVTSVDGTGTATIAIPASVGRPALVHAQYAGHGRFVVNALDAKQHWLSELAASVGGYTGTFPVGFVDLHNNPTEFLRVVAAGPWHLDIAKPVLAPTLGGHGDSGHGDAVLFYNGPAISAHTTYPGTSEFIVHAFDNGAETVLTSALGPFDGQIKLPAGPAFISVTAGGDWSMSLG